jgi:hypothetical protein
MASNYFSKQNPTDISLQSEDGGGLTLTKNGKFLFGAKLQEITDELNETSFDGVVDINPNTNSSYIGIMNANSEPVDVDIPNNNQYSLFNPPEDNIVFINPPQDDCDNEFDEIATLLLTEGNKYFTNFGFSKSRPKNLKDAKKLLLDYFYNNVLSTSLGKEVLSFAQSHPEKLIPKNLPPGLRNFFLFHSFINESTPLRHLLITVGTDFLNITNNDIDSFGDTIGAAAYTQTYFFNNEKKAKISDINGNLTNELVYKTDAPNIPLGAKIYATSNDIINIYTTNFSKIIEAYNNDKSIFLGALKSVFIRKYNEIRNKDKILLKNNPTELQKAKADVDFQLNLIESVYNISLKYINCPPPSTTPTTPTTTTPATSTPTPTPTPAVSLTAQQLEEGIYEANFLPAVENEGSQIYDYVIYSAIAPSNYPPSGLVVDGPLVPYRGSSNLTVSKGGKLVLNVGVLVGATGDVNQEIHLPHFDYRGKELPDRYRGLIPVKQVNNGDVISFADFITALKRVGLNEVQARSCMALTGAESFKDLKRAMFTGYNFNVFGLQAEGKWSSDVSQYISYRYIARDGKDNINTGEKTSLRIFAGFENIDNAIAAKTTAMNRKGFLDTTDKNDWAKKYQCTWVAFGCNDAAALKNAAAIYDTWGIRYFNKYKGTNY